MHLHHAGIIAEHIQGQRFNFKCNKRLKYQQNRPGNQKEQQNYSTEDLHCTLKSCNSCFLEFTPFFGSTLIDGLWILTEDVGSASSSSEHTWLFFRKGRSKAVTDELLSFPHPMEGCIQSNRVMASSRLTQPGGTRAKHGLVQQDLDQKGMPCAALFNKLHYKRALLKQRSLAPHPSSISTNPPLSAFQSLLHTRGAQALSGIPQHSSPALGHLLRSLGEPGTSGAGTKPLGWWDKAQGAFEQDGRESRTGESKPAPRHPPQTQKFPHGSTAESFRTQLC